MTCPCVPSVQAFCMQKRAPMHLHALALELGGVFKLSFPMGYLYVITDRDICAFDPRVVACGILIRLTHDFSPRVCTLSIMNLGRFGPLYDETTITQSIVSLLLRTTLEPIDLTRTGVCPRSAGVALLNGDKQAGIRPLDKSGKARKQTEVRAWP